MVTRSGRGREAALSLYRALLRAHAKHLPTDMRQLGDAYVKAEFRRLKAVTKSSHWEQFFNEWNSYLEHVQMAPQASMASGTTASILGDRNAIEFGKDLPKGIQLSEEQLWQLEKLKEEAIKAGNVKSR
jgi:hypothetical protein